MYIIQSGIYNTSSVYLKYRRYFDHQTIASVKSLQLIIVQ